MTSTSIPHGYHICFFPRGRKVFLPPEPHPDPETALLAVERHQLILQGITEETDSVRQAIRMILFGSHTMAEACRAVNLKQYKLNRAIKKIATRVQQG